MVNGCMFENILSHRFCLIVSDLKLELQYVVTGFLGLFKGQKAPISLITLTFPYHQQFQRK